MTHEMCKAFLKSYRKTVGAKPHEKIDKRYKSLGGWLAPDDGVYPGCCGHDAEIRYLDKIYSIVDNCDYNE